MEIQLGIVTVWYHGSENIERFVANYSQIKRPSFLHVHVINQLEASALQQLRVFFPNSTFIDVGSNIGPASAWNRGIEFLMAQGVKVISIWNPDVELADECLLKLETALLTDRTIGAVCPLLFSSEDRNQIQCYGGSIDPNTGEAKHDYRGVRDWTGLPPWRDAGYLDGGTMMIKVEAIQKAGVFDEQFFLYAEDSDICIRLRKSGYRTVAVRDAFAWHHHHERGERGPSKYIVFYDTRNKFYLVKKHGAGFAWPLLVARLAWFIPRRCVHYVRIKASQLTVPFVAGAFCGVFGVMGKRGWVN